MKSLSSPVYLAGFMGSGKSAVAPELARLLGYAHADLDAEIEKRSGMTVADIFANEGESRFRKIEREVVRELSGRTSTVVALGGGTLLDSENLELLKATGIIVYLKADAETLVGRLRSGKGRPLLADGTGMQKGGEELRATVLALLREREPSYERAQCTVSSGPGNAAATARMIAAVLRRRATP